MDPIKYKPHCFPLHGPKDNVVKEPAFIATLCPTFSGSAWRVLSKRPPNDQPDKHRPFKRQRCFFACVVPPYTLPDGSKLAWDDFTFRQLLNVFGTWLLTSPLFNSTIYDDNDEYISRYIPFTYLQLCMDQSAFDNATYLWISAWQLGNFDRVTKHANMSVEAYSRNRYVKNLYRLDVQAALTRRILLSAENTFLGTLETSAQYDWDFLDNNHPDVVDDWHKQESIDPDEVKNIHSFIGTPDDTTAMAAHLTQGYTATGDILYPPYPSYDCYLPLPPEQRQLWEDYQNGADYIFGSCLNPPTDLHQWSKIWPNVIGPEISHLLAANVRVSDPGAIVFPFKSIEGYEAGPNYELTPFSVDDIFTSDDEVAESTDSDYVPSQDYSDESD